MANVMDTNGEECSMADYDLVLDSSVGWKLINVLSGPEMVKLARMVYALERFDADQALRTFPNLKYTKSGRIEAVIKELRGNKDLRSKLSST